MKKKIQRDYIVFVPFRDNHYIFAKNAGALVYAGLAFASLGGAKQEAKKWADPIVVKVVQGNLVRVP